MYRFGQSKGGTVKNLKLGVLAFAALGLLILLSEFDMFKALLTHPFEAGGFGLLVIGGFVLALVMGIMGLTKPPFTQINAILALVGFALPAIKLKVWEALIHIGDTAKDVKGLLLVVAIIGGIVVSAMAVGKPELKA
jgi:hypothetical protein